jgi:hypothetical protein
MAAASGRGTSTGAVPAGDGLPVHVQYQAGLIGRPGSHTVSHLVDSTATPDELVKIVRAQAQKIDDAQVRVVYGCVSSFVR